MHFPGVGGAKLMFFDDWFTVRQHIERGAEIIASCPVGISSASITVTTSAMALCQAP